jgi:hypothetical protein
VKGSLDFLLPVIAWEQLGNIHPNMDSFTFQQVCQRLDGGRVLGAVRQERVIPLLGHVDNDMPTLPSRQRSEGFNRSGEIHRCRPLGDRPRLCIVNAGLKFPKNAD